MRALWFHCGEATKKAAINLCQYWHSSKAASLWGSPIIREESVGASLLVATICAWNLMKRKVFLLCFALAAKE
jgi:hypothetical protein